MIGDSDRGIDVGNRKSTRRANREGWLGYHTTRRRFYATSFIGYGPDGKPDYKWHYAKTKADVLEKKRRFDRQLADNLPVPAERLTVARYLSEWVEDMRARVKPLTWVSYELHVRRYLVPGLGRIRLGELQPRDVRRYLDALLEVRSAKTKRDLAPATVQRIHATLRRALADAVEDGILPRNVAKQARGVSVETTEERALSLPQAKQLLAALRGHPDEVLYRLDVSFGLRQGEILGLTWADVDLTEGVFHVRRQLQRIPKALRDVVDDRGRGLRYVLRDVKTGSKAHRTLPLPEPLLSALERHRRRQIAAQLAAGPTWRNEQQLVFTTSIGTPLDGRNVTKRFQALLESAGLPRFVFHELRHSAATLLLAQGVALRTIMDILGHTQERTTNRYAHRVPALQADAAAKLQDALGAEMGPMTGEQLLLFGESLSQSLSSGDVVAFPRAAEGADRA